MIRTNAAHSRPGVSLLEVLVALAIFLIALIGIGKLISDSIETAEEARDLVRAGQLCQSKMNEIAFGIVPLSSQSDAEFDEAPEWKWSLEASQESSIPNLWRATVRVHKTLPNGNVVETTQSQMIFDSNAKGAIEPDPSSTTSTTMTGGS
jgi:type II secretion system protein I